MEDRIRRLELKITELENKLKESGTTTGLSAITPEEFKTYQKVSAQFGQQIVCRVGRPYVCWPCIACLCPCGPGFCTVCGPCMESGSSTGNASFSNFM